MVAGAAIGSALNVGFYAWGQMMSGGEIDMRDVAVAAATGFVGGALAASPLGFGAEVAASAVVGVGGYALECCLKEEEMTAEGTAISAVSGAIGGLIGGKGANNGFEISQKMMQFDTAVEREARRANQNVGNSRIESLNSDRAWYMAEEVGKLAVNQLLAFGASGFADDYALPFALPLF